MKRSLFVSVLLMLSLSAAKADVYEDLAHCAGITDDQARLQCFDAQTATLRQTGQLTVPAESGGQTTQTKGTEPIPSPPAAASEPAPVFSSATPEPVSPLDLSKRQAQAEPTNRTAAQDAFGFENRIFAEGPEEIQSRYMGKFHGWSGRTLFRLENGQVWKQSDNSRLAWTADSPLITIKKAAFGSFRLEVEGVNKTCRVKRVK